MGDASQFLGEGLILVIGMPRSGTTWLGKIFDSHPDVLYRHEPDTILKINDIPDCGSVEKYTQCIASIRAFASILNQLNDPRICGKFPLFRKTYLSNVRQLTQWANIILAKALFKKFPYQIPIFGISSGTETPHVRWVWKSIESLGIMGILRKSLPKSISIHILRHPCGYVASIMRGRQLSSFDRKVPLDGNYGISKLMVESSISKDYGLSLEMLQGLSVEERLSWRWVITNDKALREEEGDSKAYKLRYEDLCRDPIQHSKALFKCSGLKWSEQTEKFIIKSTSFNSNDYYGVCKKPLEAANKWQIELNKDRVDRIMSVVHGTLSWDRYFKNFNIQR